MRTISNAVSVRLYHLTDGAEGGAANTLCYGSLDEALAMARRQPAEIQEGLFIATENDVVAFLDLEDG